MDSDTRFDLVLRDLSQVKPSSAAEPQSKTVPSFSFDKKPGLVRIRFDETALPKHVVEDFLSRVRDICSRFGVKP